MPVAMSKRRLMHLPKAHRVPINTLKRQWILAYARMTEEGGSGVECCSRPFRNASGFTTTVYLAISGLA
jgi:hypothetical protein